MGVHSSDDRIATLRRGVAALRTIEARRRAQLPPPQDEDPSRLRAVREVVELADRVEMFLDDDRTDVESIQRRDRLIAGACGPDDVRLLEALAPEVPTRDARCQIEELRELLARYVAGEFYPPELWDEISDDES